MKIVVLDGYSTNPGDFSWNWLKKYGEVTVFDRTPENQILHRAEEAELLIVNKTPLPAEILHQLQHLRYIGLLSTGYNIVDLDACRKKGIVVANVPTYSTQAVAQMVFSFLLEHCNQVALHNASVKHGEWASNPDFCYWRVPLIELYQKTIGIIGFGKIGRAVAKVAQAFEMNALIFTPHPDPALEMSHLHFVSLDELLAESDFVTLHCPLTSSTRDMANASFFAKMKRTAFFINTSRGGVVDETALYEALKKKTIAGAGLDVLATEPPAADNKLFQCDNCFITPHIAWAGYETRRRLLTVVEENIQAFLAGEPQNNVAK